jgi:hypothetical protein
MTNETWKETNDVAARCCGIDVAIYRYELPGATGNEKDIKMHYYPAKLPMTENVSEAFYFSPMFDFADLPTTEQANTLTAERAVHVLRGSGYSIRAAAYIADVLFPGKGEIQLEPKGEAQLDDDDFDGVPLSRMAKEHLARNGGKPSEKVRELLKAFERGEEFTKAWFWLMGERIDARDALWEAQTKFNKVSFAIDKWLAGGAQTRSQLERDWSDHAKENDEEGTINSLADDDAVDVVYGCDGISDDCFVTDAASLKKAGYGRKRLDGDSTLWVSRKVWERLAEQVA